MRCTTCRLAVLILVPGLACTVTAKPPEVTDPDVAAEDPDFHIQGEYLGQGVLPGGEQSKIGAQVVAQGGGEFQILFLKGGLPGEGWKRGDGEMKASGKREGDVTTIVGEDLKGQIVGGTMTVTNNDETAKVELRRVQRTSPTLGEKPPSDAIVLFSSEGVGDFAGAERSEDGNLFSGITSSSSFGAKGYELHLEFRLSWMPEARGQGRSNSGVYVHDCYEIQVLDAFGLEGRDNECGGLYKIKEPDVNMCFPPLVWQTYDIDFTAPQYNDAGEKTSNARLTVKHNGIAIHENLELSHGTPGRKGEGPGPRQLHLQGHGNRVQYRNIWLVEKK